MLDNDLNKTSYDWRERADGLSAEIKVLEVQFNS